MKRYLLVSPGPPPLHGETYAVQMMLKGFPREGVEIVHLNSRLVDTVMELQKPSFKKAYRITKHLIKLVAIRFRHRYDGVIITPSFYFGPFVKDSLFIWTARLLCFRRLIAWFHMDYRTHTMSNPSWFRRTWLRWTLKRFDYYVCVAPRLMANMPPYVPRDRMTAVLNGVPPFPGQSAQPRDDDRFRVIYCSYMAPTKGWKELLDAARIACAKNAGLEVLFFGRPTGFAPEDYLDEVFGEDDCDGRVRFMGPLEQDVKEATLRAADLFCFPSLNEAFPLAVLEAMAAGLPILASEVGGVPDALVDGKGGKLIAPGSIEQLAESLVEFSRMDPAKLQAMGDFNVARFQEVFTDEACARRWGEFLSQLAEDDGKETAKA